MTYKPFQYEGMGTDRGDRMLQKISAWHCGAYDSSWKGKRQLSEARIEFIWYSNFIVCTAAILPSKGLKTWCCFWFAYACQGRYSQNCFTSSQSFCHEEKPGWFITWQVKRDKGKKKHKLKLWWEMSVLPVLSSVEPVLPHSKDFMVELESRFENDTGSLNHR